MSFQPIIPMSGLGGWAFLNATRENQTATFEQSPTIRRDTDYFEAKISEIDSAEALVSDRRLLRVALGAFGLQEDLDNRFLIRRVLEGGVQAEDSLANKLADDRYKMMAATFGFGDGGPPSTQREGFGAEITAKFREISFEVAVGDQDESLRLAMNAERELSEMAQERPESDDALWFRIMGTPPLRKVFEVALGLPESFAQLDLDRQLEVFKDRSDSQLGIARLSDLADSDVLDGLVERYLLRDQVAQMQAQSPQAIALTLLQQLPQRI
ncbi:DUF1217 domain-containing protein [Roseovarius sp. A21]|uniref:DUF1217 domain-containing protein n=1 Tax=Roseovarius bejariae TaxID=2576383 RepID=A0A844CL21_9RHOB|nr:DUF1217 domain-containing protein [Roseovarius bejariae]MRU15447.1 DUF1217 domain-containing protein [Roseovarius bejariae]